MVKALRPLRKGSKGLDIFKSRLPGWKDIFIVLSTTVFVVFSWSIRGFLFVLPSITLRYAVVEVIAIFSYMMAFALLESFLITGVLIIVSGVLPSAWFRDGFSYKGFLAVLIGSVASIQYQAFLGSELPEAQMYYLWAGILILLLVGLFLLFHFIHRFQSVLVSIAERFTVFAYLYIPIGILGLTVVIFRNLLNG